MVSLIQANYLLEKKQWAQNGVMCPYDWKQRLSFSFNSSQKWDLQTVHLKFPDQHK